MRLKLFEAFKFNKDEYYKIIGKEEFEHLLDHIVNISSEYNYLLNKVNRNMFNISMELSPWKFKEKCYIITGSLGTHLEYYIIKIEDDWFIYMECEIIDINEWLIYKCDQLDGLSELLKDRNIIK